MGAPTASPTRPAPWPSASGGCSADEICADHEELARELALFDEVADEADDAAATSFRKDVDRAYGLLTDRLLPHVHAEQDFRTRLAVHDHRHVRDEEDHGEIERLTARLAVLRSQLVMHDERRTRRELRHVLYELHALTGMHFYDELGRQRAAAGGR